VFCNCVGRRFLKVLIAKSMPMLQRCLLLIVTSLAAGTSILLAVVRLFFKAFEQGRRLSEAMSVDVHIMPARMLFMVRCCTQVQSQRQCTGWCFFLAVHQGPSEDLAACHLACCRTQLPAGHLFFCCYNHGCIFACVDQSTGARGDQNTFFVLIRK
jgi:hypothetical protein